MPQHYSTLILIVLMVVAFYFLILRPQKKRQAAVQKTLRSLEPGARVLLGSGLFGTIVSIGDKQAVLEISPGTHLTVLKQAIVRTATDADEDTPEVDDELETGYAAGTAAEPAGYAPTTYEPLTYETPAAGPAEPLAPAAEHTPTSTESEQHLR